MTDREFYTGCGLSAIDAKGRVAIPAQLRKDVVLNNGGGSDIAIAPSRTAPCLNCFDKPYVKLIPALIERDYLERKPNEPELTREFLARQAAGAMETLPFDASGRFIISPLMRKLGKLDDLAFFFGAFDVVEIWRPEFALDSTHIPDVVRASLEHELEDRARK